MVLKEVNRDLEGEGVLTLRLTQDIWTKLMSNLLQGEYLLAIPIRQDLQKHIRAKRPDKIYTFNQIIQRLDEILDRYIPPPDLSEAKKRKDREKKNKKKPEVIILPDPKPNMASYQDTKRLHTAARDLRVQIDMEKKEPRRLPVSTRNMTAQTDTKMAELDFEERRPKPNREISLQTSRVVLKEATTQIKGDTFVAEERHDMSVETDKEERYEEDEISREQFLSLQEHQSVLMKTVQDQQMKIKRLEETVNQLERKNITLVDELKSINAEKGDKIDVYSKIEREIKFLRNELKIKERTLQLSLIERNELLDRLSTVTSHKMANGSINSDLGEINRPTQIADKYAKLFESEWTDAFNLLTLEMKEERSVVQWLLEILIDSYSFCKTTNETHTRDIIERLLYPFKRPSDVKNVDPYAVEEISMRLITDLKKTTAKDTVSQIQVQFLKAMQKTQKKYYEDKMVKKLTSYIDKCVELCWYMVNQDPVIYLDDHPPKSGDEFDRDVYRFHTKSGSKVDYLVWPALYFAKGNYMLEQGVAQSKQEGVALRIASSRSLRLDLDDH